MLTSLLCGHEGSHSEAYTSDETVLIFLSRAALFEEAALALKPDPGSTASQRFRMLLALSSELHQVRARISIAASQSREGHPGAACADLLVCQTPNTSAASYPEDTLTINKVTGSLLTQYIAMGGPFC
jgi:hypothetical protein